MVGKFFLFLALPWWKSSVKTKRMFTNLWIPCSLKPTFRSCLVTFRSCETSSPTYRGLPKSLKMILKNFVLRSLEALAPNSLGNVSELKHFFNLLPFLNENFPHSPRMKFKRLWRPSRGLKARNYLILPTDDILKYWNHTIWLITYRTQKISSSRYGFPWKIFFISPRSPCPEIAITNAE